MASVKYSCVAAILIPNNQSNGRSVARSLVLKHQMIIYLSKFRSYVSKIPRKLIPSTLSTSMIQEIKVSLSGDDLNFRRDRKYFKNLPQTTLLLLFL